MAETSLGRRDFLAGAALAAATVASPSARAAHHGYAQHTRPHAQLADAAGDCVRAGADCRAHCLEEFRDGRTQLAACAARVEEMMASCEALGRLAAQESAHVAGMAAVAEAICAECEQECRRHADMHETCRRCAEACTACREACKDLQTG